MKKKEHYKFTQKKRSARGTVALLLSLAAAAIFVAAVAESFLAGGDGSVYLGSAGILSLLLSVCALILAILAMREEDTFKTLPRAGLFCSILVTALMSAVYAVGFFL